MNTKFDFFHSASIYSEETVTVNADYSASYLIFQENQQAVMSVSLWKSGHPAIPFS